MKEILDEIVNNADEWLPLNSFQLRKKLESRFPGLTTENYSWISEAIELSTRLSEKNFPFHFWLSSFQTFEQATNFKIAQFHSRLLSKPNGKILDACAGAGFDAIAFLNDGNQVTSCELNESSAKKLNLNRELYGLSNWKINQTNCIDENPKSYSALYFDPMRRMNNKRMVRIEDYSPGIQEIAKFTKSGIPILIKTSPLLTITPEIKNEFQMIFVSRHFECKEILLAKNLIHLPQNSLYFADHDFHFNLDNLQDQPNENGKSDLNEFQFIYEPNPALLKSGMVKQAASHFDIVQPSENCGYFFGNNYDVEHLFRRYQLIDNQYYKINKINKRMNQFSGEIILKKKNSSFDLNSIKLGKRKIIDNSKTIFFITEHEGKTVFWIGKSVD